MNTNFAKLKINNNISFDIVVLRKVRLSIIEDL